MTTLAGLAGYGGSANGTNSDARFNSPTGVALDSAGKFYVVERGNGTIRKATPAGTNWVLTTLAAGFAEPKGLAVDSAGNVYVADTLNHTIRKVTPARVVTTLAGLAGSPGSADGIGSGARFNYPSGIAVDSASNVYVADAYNNTIRKLTPIGTNWVVTTLGGMSGFYGTADGTGSAARFCNPNGVAVDSAGNLYVADFYFNTIRKGYPPPMFRNSEINLVQFRSILTGPPGQLVVVEASSDLLNWLPIWTNTFAGPLNFSDPQSGISSNRFYRARLP